MATKKSSQRLISVPSISIRPSSNNSSGRPFTKSELPEDDECFARVTGDYDLADSIRDAVESAWSDGNTDIALNIARDYYKDKAQEPRRDLQLEEISGFEVNIKTEVLEILQDKRIEIGRAVEMMRILGKGWNWSGIVRKACEHCEGEGEKDEAMRQRAELIREFLGSLLQG